MRLGVVAELVGCVGVVGLEEGVVRVLLRQSRDVTKLEPHKKFRRLQCPPFPSLQ